MFVDIFNTDKKYDENAEQHPDYFLCGKSSVPKLKEKARKEADRLLKEFSAFYRGNIGIEIGEKQHLLGWSITATLTVNGKKVRREDPCDLLFLDLNELMLKRLKEVI